MDTVGLYLYVYEKFSFLLIDSKFYRNTKFITKINKNTFEKNSKDVIVCLQYEV